MSLYTNASDMHRPTSLMPIGINLVRRRIETPWHPKKTVASCVFVRTHRLSVSLNYMTTMERYQQTHLLMIQRLPMFPSMKVAHSANAVVQPCGNYLDFPLLPVAKTTAKATFHGLNVSWGKFSDFMFTTYHTEMDLPERPKHRP